MAAMHDSTEAGLDRMPTVELAVAALIVSPDEALRREVWCPRPQLQMTNAGAHAGSTG